MAAYLGAVTIEWDDAALEDLLNTWTGPVGLLIIELSAQTAARATALVHVLPGTPRSGTWSPRSNARPPGFTKARIRPHQGIGPATGRIYGGANAPADPTIFLEYPAEQMYEKYPFMTTALDSLVV